VTRALDIDYPKDQTAAAKEKREKAARMMYAATHPVSKRNITYTLDPKVPNLKAAWVPGVPRPSRGQTDEFLKVKTGGIPAGARKLYVTVEACKRIASNGLLVAMPGVATLPKINAALLNVKKQGVAAHVGASYYLRHTGKKPYRVEQNMDEFRVVTICAGAYLQIVAPGSTLAASPAFTNAHQEAMAKYGDWVAECRTYADLADKRADAGLADILGQYSAGVEEIGSVEQARKDFEDISDEDPMGKARAARDVITTAKQISRDYMVAVEQDDLIGEDAEEMSCDEEEEDMDTDVKPAKTRVETEDEDEEKLDDRGDDASEGRESPSDV